MAGRRLTFDSPSTPQQLCGSTAACKTYFESVRRSYRYSKPEFSLKAEAARQSAKSRSRRKMLLEARRSVLQDGEDAVFKGATVDLMSDEDDGYVDGVAAWIVRPPPSRSQELTDLCAVLQARLEANPKYAQSHHRRLKETPGSQLLIQDEDV